jgi:cell division septation protein DedD
MKRVTGVLLLLAVAALPPEVEAQRPDPLPEVERLLAGHQYAEARSALARFWTDPGESLQGDRRARALYLRAVLAGSIEDAERDLLRIAVEHPQSPEADRALFRLAQARSASGDDEGASTYLERLVRDHPASSLRDPARGLLGLAAEPAAAARPVARSTPTPASSAPATPPAARGQRPAAAASAAPAPLTVQVGRFDSVSEAEVLRDRLRAAGYQAFLARVGQSGATVVRVGQFTDRGSADAMARRLRGAGFQAQITSVYAD